MTDLKPCPECGTMCEVEELQGTSGVLSFYEQYTRHVTPEEKLRDEKAKMLDELISGIYLDDAGDMCVSQKLLEAIEYRLDKLKKEAVRE